MRKALPSIGFLVLLSVLACGVEAVSQRPLGLGPLALAERSAAASSDAVAKAQVAARVESDEDEEEAGPALVVSATVLASAAPSASGAPAASGSASSPEALAVWVGEYVGTDVTRLTIPPLPESKQDDPKARLRITRLDASRLAFTMVASNTGEVICTLHARVTGSTATLDSGQVCVQGALAATVERGTATLTGSKVVVELTASVLVGDDEETRNGTMAYRFEGTRQ